MPKQPLNKNRDKISPIIVGPQTFAERPKLAVYVAQIIAGWAQVDLALAVTFARYRRQNIEQSIDDYLSDQRFSTQGEMLDAAARDALTADNFLLYSATMRFIKSNYNIRNEMAHWGWGVTNSLPDALIIFEPIISKKFNSLAFNLHGQDMGKIMPRILELRASADKSTFFYKESDLQKCADDMFKAEIYADRLQGLNYSTSETKTSRDILLNRPEIKQFYENLVAKEAKASKP